MVKTLVSLLSKSWNKSVKHLFNSRISDLQKKIARLQTSIPSDNDVACQIESLQSQLDALLYKEEIYWRQRARVHKLQARDKNTKFFHQFASHKKKNNTIKFLKDDSDLDCSGPPLEDPKFDFLGQPFSVDEAIPTYAMACFRLPIKLCRGIEVAMARFWWGSSGDSKKIHWKSWKSVCKSKFMGGLGFRSLIQFNQAMLAKQAWIIFKNLNSLLSLVLKARYFPNSSIFEVAPGHNPFFSWRSIFWGRDLVASDDSISWDLPKLRCHFEDSLVNDILEVSIIGLHKKDELIWGKESYGLFSVKYAYHLALSKQDIPSSSSSTESKKFWTTDLNSRKYSIGVIILDELNQVRAGISRPFVGSVPPAVVEAKAILHAIQWAQIESNELAHKVAKLGLGLDNELVWNGHLPSL
uniref:RNase H type-1 domain-containing protein n=1 Tax=Cannabis sativa TaxID=3483 RepID=A0A803PU82_CANSA